MINQPNESELPLAEMLAALTKRHGIVGATAGILRNGDIQLAASGLLNASTGVEATTDSVFQIGSIGKVFTTTLMMQLVDEGKLDLDEPVRRYFADFAIADDAAAARITPRMLLCHLSGMEGDFFPEDDPEGPSTTSYVRKMRLLPQLMQPGEEPMAYCNSGFMVAGRIIEILTGLTWERAVMQKICRPLGLEQAFTDLRDSIKFRCAMGHIYNPVDPGKFIVSPSTYLPLSAAAAGAVLSMPAEGMLRFAQMHMNLGLSIDGTRILSEKSVQMMREAQTALPPFSLPEFNHWGLGWMLGEFENYRSCGHDGGTLGQFCYLRVFPEHQAAVALLTNSPGPKMALAFLDWAVEAATGLKRPPEPVARPEPFDVNRYVGNYGNISTRHQVHADGEDLFIKIVDVLMGSPDIHAKLVPYRKDVFHIDTDHPRYQDSKISFLGDDGTGRAIFSRITVRMLRRLI